MNNNIRFFGQFSLIEDRLNVFPSFQEEGGCKKGYLYAFNSLSNQRRIKVGATQNLVTRFKSHKDCFEQYGNSDTIFKAIIAGPFKDIFNIEAILREELTKDLKCVAGEEWFNETIEKILTYFLRIKSTAVLDKIEILKFSNILKEALEKYFEKYSNVNSCRVSLSKFYDGLIKRCPEAALLGKFYCLKELFILHKIHKELISIDRSSKEKIVQFDRELLHKLSPFA